MSALRQLISAEKNAREFGFEWPNAEMILDQVIDECREIKEDISSQAVPDKLQEEIGDLIHAAISLCCFLEFDVEDTIIKASQKFTQRMLVLKSLTQKRGLNDLKNQSIELMLDLWQQVKVMISEDEKFKPIK